MKDLSVRLSRPDDSKRLSEISCSHTDTAWSEESFLNTINSKQAQVIVVDTRINTEDLILGYVVLSFAADEGEIPTIACDPDYRRIGVGDLLMSSIKDAAEDLSLNSIYLEVRVSNEPAIRLYSKHGFERIGIRKDFYKTEDAIVMRVEL